MSRVAWPCLRGHVRKSLIYENMTKSSWACHPTTEQGRSAKRNLERKPTEWETRGPALPCQMFKTTRVDQDYDDADPCPRLQPCLLSIPRMIYADRGSFAGRFARLTRSPCSSQRIAEVWPCVASEPAGSTCSSPSPPWSGCAAHSQAPVQPSGEKHALLIGVHKYAKSSELRELHYTERGVDELAQVLRDGGYRPENLVLIRAGAEGEAG